MFYLCVLFNLVSHRLFIGAMDADQDLIAFLLSIRGLTTYLLKVFINPLSDKVHL